MTPAATAKQSLAADLENISNASIGAESASGEVSLEAFDSSSNGSSSGKGKGKGKGGGGGNDNNNNNNNSNNNNSNNNNSKNKKADQQPHEIIRRALCTPVGTMLRYDPCAAVVPEVAAVRVRQARAARNARVNAMGRKYGGGGGGGGAGGSSFSSNDIRNKGSGAALDAKAEEGRLRSLERLNESQRGAMEHAVTRRLTLVQGPPGTGKTHTAVEILVELVRIYRAKGKQDKVEGRRPVQSSASSKKKGQSEAPDYLPLLATSDSNIAVDNLLEGLADRGVRAVRVGRSKAIRDDLLEFSLDKCAGKGRSPQKLLAEAEVICATCIGSGSDMLSRFRFHTVLIDEVSQATETACLVPISQGCQQLILVGDHCQLPPTIISEEAERRGLAVSLFSRFVAQGVRPVLLDTQYRMHPAIAEFSSMAFYNSRLRDGVVEQDRIPPPLKGLSWPGNMPVLFEDCSNGEETKDGYSFTNHIEAERVIKVVVGLLEASREQARNGVGRGFTGLHNGPADIGVVTPYAGQVRLIQRMIRDKGLDRPGKRLTRPGEQPPVTLEGLEISSVDGFQGREKEVIVFSAVRNNRQGNLGFVGDWRRTNVMITRARRGLIICGSAKTLGKDDVWGNKKGWLKWYNAAKDKSSKRRNTADHGGPMAMQRATVGGKRRRKGPVYGVQVGVGGIVGIGIGIGIGVGGGWRGGGWRVEGGGVEGWGGGV